MEIPLRLPHVDVVQIPSEFLIGLDSLLLNETDLKFNDNSFSISQKNQGTI